MKGFAMLRGAAVVGTLILLLAFPRVGRAQTATYHLHNENSSTLGLSQLKTIGPDVATVAIQTGDLKSHPAEDSFFRIFDTQAGVPGLVGTIPANATVTFTFWMKKTSSYGVVYPRAQLSLNWTPTATLCAGNGSTALTTTLQSYTFTCTLPSAITMVTSDRFTLFAGYHMTQGPGNKTMKVELDIEGISPSTDSTVVAPTPVPPAITSLNPTSGPVNWGVTVTGTSFGDAQGSSTLKFNGTTATPTSWSSTSIAAPVPAGATTGPVVVTVNGAGSNGVTFTVIPPPTISTVTPTIGHVGDAVTITGANFLATQGSSTVKFNGTTAIATSWSDISISTTVPTGATPGNVVVTVSSQASNGVPFTVIIPGTIGGTIMRVTGGTGISGASVQAVLAGVIKGSATTAANGTYSIPGLDPASYDVRVLATGFSSELRQGIAVTASTTTTVDVAMYAPGSVSGRVTQADGITPIVGAAVAVYSGPVQKGSTNTNATGDYSIAGLHPGSYTVQAANVGYRTSEQGAVVNESATTTKNFSLNAAPAGPVLYAYDELGRLVQVTDPSGDSAVYRYDAVGNITAIERPGSGSVSISAFTPLNGPVGTAVTIYGTGFSTTPGQNTVTFNAVAGTVTSATATQIIAAVPAGATTGAIAVTTPSGSATSTQAFTVTSAGGPPTITSFSPAIGSAGASLTITGTNFEAVPANDRVNINVTLANVSAASTTNLTATVPLGSNSGPVTVATPSGTATSATDFFVPPSPFTATDVEFTARMSIGGTQVVPINTPNKIGLVTFAGTAGQRISLQGTDGLSGQYVGCDLNVSIADPYGVNLSNLPTCMEQSGFIDTKPLTTGTYTILVDPASTATGSVTLTLYSVTDFTSTITVGGSSVIVPISTPGQNGMLTFAGTAGQRVSLRGTNGTIFGQTFGCDVNVTILKPLDKTELAPATCMEFGGLVDTVTLPTTGTYTILVDPGSFATGNLTLTLYDITDFSGTITPGGSPVIVPITMPGQNGVLTFAGTTGQRVSLQGTDGTIFGQTNGCDVNVSILKPPDNSVLAPATCMEFGGFIDTVTLPTTGTYTILVDPGSFATGNLTLTLYNVPADFTGSVTINGSTLPVPISVPGQNADVTFAGTSGQSIRAPVTTPSFGTCATLTLLRQDNSTVVTTYNSCGTTITLPSTSLPATETYHLRLDPSSTATGNFTVSVVSP